MSGAAAGLAASPGPGRGRPVKTGINAPNESG
jgi:hypothetical protein